MPTIHSLLLKTAGLLLALSTAAMAQDYPTKPIRMIIPFPPGGSNDVVGRLFATHLSERLGKQVIVDNRGAGAGGIVGTEIVAHAPHDGYTIGVISLAHAVNPWLYKLPYDPIKAFTPVGILGSGPNVLVVNPELPVHSVKELIALAKEKPGQLQYASAGVGSFQHLGGELFKLMAKVNMLHVPFKGGGPAMIDVVGGHTKVMFSSLVQTTPAYQVRQAARARHRRPKRSPVLPGRADRRRGRRAGLRGDQLVGHRRARGHAARNRRTLHKAITEVQDSPEVQKQFVDRGRGGRADEHRPSSAPS